MTSLPATYLLEEQSKLRQSVSRMNQSSRARMPSATFVCRWCTVKVETVGANPTLLEKESVAL